jgi:hypothetical protein
VVAVRLTTSRTHARTDAIGSSGTSGARKARGRVWTGSAHDDDAARHQQEREQGSDVHHLFRLVRREPSRTAPLASS